MASLRESDPNAWLDQVREPALDPERPICDPHHHLWSYPTSRYELDELGADAFGGPGGGLTAGADGHHRVEGTVFVECSSEYATEGPTPFRPLGETRYVVDLAEQSERRTDVPNIEGIVGFADLTLGDHVVPVLEAHLETGRTRFKGIRHAAGWHASDEIRNSHTNPPEHLLLDASFRAGFGELEPLGLSFDAWLYHQQIPELTDLARAFPDTRIVLDHLGGPLGIGVFAGKGEEVLASWRESITELARCENVWLKFGGLLMPINGHGFHHRDRPPGSQEVARTLRPWFDICLSLFGPERMMFESNFPVDRASCSYGVLWNGFKLLAQDLSELEKERLFRSSARAFYRL